MKVNELITFINRNGLENFIDLDVGSWVSYEQARSLLVNESELTEDAYVRVKTKTDLIEWSMSRMTIMYDINVIIYDKSFTKQCIVKLEFSQFEWKIISIT